MARDWEATQTLADIQAKIAGLGVNIAPIPLAMAQEIRGRGKIVWTVDIHVKIFRKTEFEIATEGPSLSDALRKAHTGLAIEAKMRAA